MLKITVIFFASLMLAVGLLGFFIPNLFYLVQFDLFQSFLYSLLGAVGLKLGLASTTNLARRRYLDVLAIVNLILFMLGLSWPNFGDVFHLEVPEHFFHAGVGVVAALAASYWRKASLPQNGEALARSAVKN